jgi:hypothetical protein
VTIEDVLAMPSVLIGSYAEMVEQLLSAREQYGISYLIVTGGLEAIRGFYAQRLSAADRPRFTGEIQPALAVGDVALTSTLYETTSAEGVVRTASTELARRQPDGSWLWVIDLPAALRGRSMKKFRPTRALPAATS